jgi:outer membrane biosynthesis protein TonB
MDEIEKTAQERLQEKALANARALLDKLENEPRGVGLGTALVLAALVVAIVVGWGFLVRSQAYKDPVKPTAEMSSPEYAAYVMSRIQGKANSPRKDRSQLDAPSGEISVAIAIYSRGITELTIEKSSGDSHSDDRLKSFVKFAEPFGSPPAAAGFPFVVRARIRGDGKDRLVVEQLPPRN